jgi:REP element-mobilizing transposase RayT
MAASAALRAIRDLPRNFGWKSSTAISWWSSTTRRAQTRAAWWTNSYFVATVGGATLEVVKQYVENQRNA